MNIFRRNARALLALLLSLCLLSGGVPALADPENNTGGSIDPAQQATVEATVTDGDNDNKQEVAVEVTGDVDCDGKTGIAVVVDTVDQDTKSVQVSIGGEEAKPVEPDTMPTTPDTESVTVNVTEGDEGAQTKGDVNVTNGKGIEIKNQYDDNATAHYDVAVTVTAGDIHLSGTGGYSVFVGGYAGSNTVEVGDIAIGGNEGDAIDYACGVNAQSQGAKNQITAGDIAATNNAAPSGGTGNGSAEGVSAWTADFAVDGASNDIAVGTITATADPGSATGVTANAIKGDNAVKVNVADESGAGNSETAGTNDPLAINATGWTGATGVYANAKDGSANTVTAGGGVSATSAGGGARGLSLSADGSKTAGEETVASANTVTVQAGGVSATSEASATSEDSDAIGVTATAKNTGENTVTVQAGGVSATSAEGEAKGLNLSADGSQTVGEETIVSANTVTVQAGGVKATSGQYAATGVGAEAKNGGQNTVTVQEGGIEASATTDNRATGVSLGATGGKNVVKVEDGGVSATAGDSQASSATGVSLASFSGGANEIDVAGDVTAVTKSTWTSATGVSAYAQQSGSNAVATGGVSATSGLDATGVSVTANGGENDITVNGAVEASADSSAYGVNASIVGASSKNTVAVLGAAGEDGERTAVEATAAKTARGISVVTQENSETRVCALGDVTATATGEDGKGYGLFLTANGVTGGPADVQADGTISGTTAAIAVSQSIDADETSVTAWAAEANGDGAVVAASDPENETNAKVAQAVQSAINYIVKLAGGLTNGNVTTEKGNTVTIDEKTGEFERGTTQTEGYTWHTANEDEDVTLSFRLAEGEALDGVYYNADDGNSLVAKESVTEKEGVFSYVFKMLRGGAMKLGLKTHRHDFSVFVEHASLPTCTQPGEDVYRCQYCDSTQNRPVDALNHDYSAAVTPPTCTEKGYTTHTCGRCQDSYVDSYVDALNHDYSAAVTPPTCTERGYTTHTCGRCQDSYVDSYVDALNHDYSAVVTPPTCTERGYTTHTCGRCQDSYVDGYVDAPGHDYSAAVTPPTCAEKGYTTHTCTRCKDSYTDAETAAKGHAWGAPEYAWAADNSAVTAKRVCGNDASHVETETAKAVRTVTTPAAAGKAGVATYTATFKNAAFETQTRTEAIPALPDETQPGNADQPQQPAQPEQGQEQDQQPAQPEQGQEQGKQPAQPEQGQGQGQQQPRQPEQGQEQQPAQPEQGQSQGQPKQPAQPEKGQDQQQPAQPGQGQGRQADDDAPGAPQAAVGKELVYEETPALRGLNAEERPAMGEALDAIGNSLAGTTVSMWFLNEEKVVPAKLLKRFDALSLKDRLFILMDLLGCGEPEGLSEAGRALLAEMHAELEAMTDAERAARQAELDACFQPRHVQVDGVTHESVCFELEIQEGGKRSYERYTFYLDGKEWKLFRLETGLYRDRS